MITYFYFQDSGQSRSASVTEDNSIDRTTEHIKDLVIEENKQCGETTDNKQLQSEVTEDGNSVDATEKTESDTATVGRNEAEPESTATKEVRSVRDGDTLLTSSSQEGFSDSEKDESTSDDDDDEDGWITPNNIASIKQSMGEPEVRSCVPVACLTTDFAMQVRLLLLLLIYW